METPSIGLDGLPLTQRYRSFSVPAPSDSAGYCGAFSINAGLAIPFDGFSGMEVDLLCDKARVVIELDGPQHLGDPVAYRRDRRKGQLLQENG